MTISGRIRTASRCANALPRLITYKARLAIPERWKRGTGPARSRHSCESGNPFQSRVPGFLFSPCFHGNDGLKNNIHLNPVRNQLHPCSSNVRSAAGRTAPASWPRGSPMPRVTTASPATSPRRSSKWRVGCWFLPSATSPLSTSPTDARAPPPASSLASTPAGSLPRGSQDEAAAPDETGCAQARLTQASCSTIFGPWRTSPPHCWRPLRGW